MSPVVVALLVDASAFAAGAGRSLTGEVDEAIELIHDIPTYKTPTSKQ